MLDFRGFLSSLSVRELREYASMINGEILSRCSPVSRAESTSHSYTVDDYVDYRSNFLDPTERELVMAECEGLHFNSKTPSDAVQNRFLSFGKESYSWNSSSGPVVNDPLDLNSFTSIKNVLSKINSDLKCSLNSALVSFYKSGDVSARLHSDDEPTLDSSQPIVVVSIGAVRRVEFVDNRQDSFRRNALTLDPEDCSVYIMKPGCQERFRHRVRMERRVNKSRISISFRAFKSAAVQETTPSRCSVVTAASPDSSLNFVTPDSKHEKSFSPVSPIEVENCGTQLGKDTAKSADSPYIPVSKDHSVGYSPFNNAQGFNSSWTSTSAHTKAGGAGGKEKICLILGTSITQSVEGHKMSKKGRTVVNLSSSGAYIEHIKKMAHDFHYENPNSIHKVDKIVVSAGTNEIKWYNCHSKNLRHEFKPKLIDLIIDLKQLFPAAHITFQTVLPIRIVYNYTVDSVHGFNNLLLEVCSQYGCTFYDCFSRFLDREGVNPNRLLYRDNWHLSDIGLKVLCRALKFLIYGNIFNPIPRYSLYPRFYPSV